MTDMKQGLILAGTGHRPNRLGGYNDTTRNRLGILASTIVRRLEPKYGYCGGALGWDQAWGMALMGAGIPYCMSLPFPDMGKRWYQKDRDTLAVLIAHADRVHYLSDHYHRCAYILRDQYMVANAEGVVSLLDPLATESGTYHTCEYAEKLTLPILQLWDEYIALRVHPH